jgi:hypothetical protein
LERASSTLKFNTNFKRPADIGLQGVSNLKKVANNQMELPMIIHLSEKDVFMVVSFFIT